jgi:RecB family exonuclease
MATDPAVWKDHAARLAAAHQWPDTLERVERLIDAFLRSPVSEWDIDQARVEVPFSISCEGRQVTGLIDALPTHPDGAPLVLDYKTGTTAPDQTQLLIYLLATHRDEGIPADAPAVEAAFLRVDKRDEFYLDRLDVSDLDATLGEAEERLTEWVQVAEMARYNAPEPGPHCECCGYQDVCDAAKEGQ